MSTVFVMCGGFGKRMGNTTQAIPKTLIEVQGRPMIDHIVRNFQKQGFERFVFGTGYLSEKVEEYIEKELQPLECVISNSGPDAGMFQRLWQAQSYFDDTVVVAYGDTFVDLDYQNLVEFHNSNSSEITLVAGEIQNPFGVITTDNKNQVMSFTEKPTYQYYIGSFVLNRSALYAEHEKYTEKQDGLGLVEFFQEKITKGQAQRYLHKGMQVTFNTESELAKAEQAIGQYYTIKES